MQNQNPTDNNTKAKIAKLFNRFLEIWPEKWARKIALCGVHVLSKDWAEHTKKYTWEVMETACNKAILLHDWPPEIKEFKAICDGLVMNGIVKDGHAEYEARRLEDKRDNLIKKIKVHVGKLYFAGERPKEALAMVERLAAICAYATKLIGENPSIEKLEAIEAEMLAKINAASHLQP